MSKTSQWIVGINAVASALEHDAQNVREVLVESGGRNARLTDIEAQARRLGIDVRRVAQQALDGVHVVSTNSRFPFFFHMESLG